MKIKQCPINTENPNKGVCPFGFHLLGKNNPSGKKLSDTSLSKNHLKTVMPKVNSLPDGNFSSIKKN